MSERVHYWSMIKGVAILAVLAIHIPLTNDTNSVLASRQIINFPVAMFMFLSGFFVKEGTNMWNSVKRLLWPYIIWSGIWCIIIPPQSVLLIISKLLFGGFSILYFLCVLIQLKLLTPWLLKHIKSEDYRITKDPLWLITPLYLLSFSLIRLYAGNEFVKVNEIVPFNHFFPSWLIYYYLGMVCKFKTIKIRPIYALIALMVSYYLSILVSFWLNDCSSIHNFPYTQSKLTSMLIALSVIMLIYSVRDLGMKRNILARIGEWSFGIYLLHMPVKMYFQGFITFAHLRTLNMLYNYPLIKYIFVLLISSIIITILNHILPSKAMRVLGLQ